MTSKAEGACERSHVWLATEHSTLGRACLRLPRRPTASHRRLWRLVLRASSADVEKGHGQDEDKKSGGRRQPAKSQLRGSSPIKGVVLRSDGRHSADFSSRTRRRVREQDSLQNNLATALENYEKQRLKGGVTDIVDFTTAIEACRDGGDGESALRVFRELQAAGVSIASETYNITLDALARGDQLDDAFELIDEMTKDSIDIDINTYNAVISGYMHGREVRVDKALQVST